MPTRYPAHGAAGNMGHHNFVIRNNAGTYEAYNGETGAKDYSNASAKTVIEAAWNAIVAAGGGTVALRAGTYDCTTGLALIGDYTRLMGDGIASTVLQFNTGAGIVLGTNIARHYYNEIADLTAMGKGTYTDAGTLILSKCQTGTRLQRLYLMSCMNAIQYAPYIYMGENVIRDVKVENCKVGYTELDTTAVSQAAKFDNFIIFGPGAGVAGSKGIEHLTGNTNYFHDTDVESAETAYHLRNVNACINSNFVNARCESCLNGIDFDGVNFSGLNNFFGGYNHATNRIVNDAVGGHNHFYQMQNVTRRFRGSAAILSGQTAIQTIFGAVDFPLGHYSQVKLTRTNVTTSKPRDLYVSAIAADRFTASTDADPGASTLTFDYIIEEDE